MSELLYGIVLFVAVGSLAWVFYQMGRRSWTYSEARESGVTAGIEIGRKVERKVQEERHQPPLWWIEQMKECQEAHLPGDCVFCGAK